MEKLSFVIPVFNSYHTIGKVVDEIEKTVLNLDTKYEFEVILVNDNSKDNTLDKCKEICASKPYVKLISFAKNFGQHNALMAGFRHVTGDLIVCLDDDMQTPPDQVSKLIGKLNQGYDVVFGKYATKKHSSFRNLGSKINLLMATWLINLPQDIEMTSFFIVRRYIVDEIIRYDNPYPYIGGLIVRATRNLGNVQIEHKEREIGKSNYSLKKLISLWLNSFTNFSVKPLRIASLMGAIFSLTGFIIMILLIIRRIINPNIPMGWTSTMVITMFFGGIQLLCLGLVGEYVGRIYLSINKAPQYVVKEKYNISEDSK